LKLFIGNLAFGTTSEDLTVLCSQYGEVVSSNVVTDRETGRSRGFAFVEMQNGGDDAVQALNRQDFQGRNLTVNEAKAREDRPRSNGSGSYGGGGYGGGDRNGGGYGNR
jgi:RNA recognition motif-containing protein